MNSEYFNIPVYESGETDTQAKLQLETEIKLDSISPNIWEQSAELSETFDRIEQFNLSFSPLEKISNLPLNYLSLLSQSNPNSKDSLPNNFDTTPKWFKIVVIILFCIVLILGAIIAYLKIRIKCIKCADRRVVKVVTPPQGVRYELERPEQIELVEVSEPARFSRPAEL